MKNSYDNAVALLIYMASGEFITSLFLVPINAPLRWWLIAQLPIALIAMLITAVTAGSNTRGE